MSVYNIEGKYEIWRGGAILSLGAVTQGRDSEGEGG